MTSGRDFIKVFTTHLSNKDRPPKEHPFAQSLYGSFSRLVVDILDDTARRETIHLLVVVITLSSGVSNQALTRILSIGQTASQRFPQMPPLQLCGR